MIWVGDALVTSHATSLMVKRNQPGGCLEEHPTQQRSMKRFELMSLLYTFDNKYSITRMELQMDVLLVLGLMLVFSGAWEEWIPTTPPRGYGLKFGCPSVHTPNNICANSIAANQKAESFWFHLPHLAMLALPTTQPQRWGIHNTLWITINSLVKPVLSVLIEFNQTPLCSISCQCI